MRARTRVAVSVVAAALVLPPVAAQPVPDFDPSLFREFSWRLIGPFRGGRTTAAAGVPSLPHVFYAGAAQGGVWKTTDAGRTWTPTFDDQSTGAIGAIGVAPSNPDVIYVGTGAILRGIELAAGDGLFKSTDGGRTWTHAGLRDSRHIPQIIVDPRNPNRLFVAVLGHAHGPSVERGIFRSLDGARTFERVLSRDENTGGIDVAFDPADATVVYAALWTTRQAPWDDLVWSGAGSGLFKSSDGGTSWRPLTSGLPTFADDELGRIGVAVAPSNPRRLFAVVGARTRGGVYRSDDAGETWALANGDARVVSAAARSGVVAVDPKNADVVYLGSTAAWKSSDGGRTFAAWPDRDDDLFHRLWINPERPNVMLAATDEGALVTVNGGETWSSRHGQPTAAFDHVTADNAFPYRVCGGQAERGSVCVANRGAEGHISFRDWQPIGFDAYGPVAPDPNEPEVMYGGTISRYDRRTGQTQDISPPRDDGYRVSRGAPVVFSPMGGKVLFFGANTLWRTANGGQTWTASSPDLSRETWEVPASAGVFRTRPEASPARRGLISAIGPSYVDANVVWAGTSDGLVHVSRDGGKTWLDVTPPGAGAWAKISVIEPSHFDANFAYVAINTRGLDDLRPHLYRTKDGGKTWMRTVNGLPDSGMVNAVREDASRRGLLFAGSDRGVHVSFDDGERWQSMRLNLPATPIRDLVIKDDDLIAGTSGRGFWILDDVTPLRQITPAIARADAFLFRPPTAWRVRTNRPPGSPSPFEEPAARNPPDGVPISYLLGPGVTSVVLEIVDSASGEVLRRVSNDDPEEPTPGREAPDAPRGPSSRLVTTPGLHRFVWNLRYAPPPMLDPSAPPGPPGLWPMPAAYQVRLSVNTRPLRQAVLIKLDPRVRTPVADLLVQFKLSRRLDEAIRQVARTAADVRARPSASGDGEAARRSSALDALTQAHTSLVAAFVAVQTADARPTAAAEARAIDAIVAADAAIRRATGPS